MIRVFVDNKFLFENLQINEENCKSVYLTSGGKGFMHSIIVDGFYNGGEENTGGVVLTWRGPGTQNKLVPVQSADATSAPPPPPSHFHLRVWASPTDLQVQPDSSFLQIY